MGNLAFQVRKEQLSNGSTVGLVHLKGSIDGSTVKLFETESMKLFDEGVRYLILNFAQIGYMNSTGLGILVKVLDTYQDKEGDVKLVNVPHKVADLFDMLGISSILDIYKTNDEALESLPASILPPIPGLSDDAEVKDETRTEFTVPSAPISMNTDLSGGGFLITPDQNEAMESSIGSPGGIVIDGFGTVPEDSGLDISAMGEGVDISDILPGGVEEIDGIEVEEIDGTLEPQNVLSDSTMEALNSNENQKPGALNLLDSGILAEPASESGFSISNSAIASEVTAEPAIDLSTTTTPSDSFYIDGIVPATKPPSTEDIADPIEINPPLEQNAVANPIEINPPLEQDAVANPIEINSPQIGQEDESSVSLQEVENKVYDMLKQHEDSKGDINKTVQEMIEEREKVTTKSMENMLEERDKKTVASIEQSVQKIVEERTIANVQNVIEEREKAAIANMEQMVKQMLANSNQTKQLENLEGEIQVRYYQQVNPLKSFPLAVTLPNQSISGTVTIIPSLPGCAVVPASRILELGSESKTVEFTMTPASVGQISGEIEVHHQGKVINSLSVKAVSAGQGWAKIGMAGAVIIPLIALMVDGIQWNTRPDSANVVVNLIHTIQSNLGLASFGLICGAISLVMGIFFYNKNKPKESKK